jgi:hypothetical protein
LDKICCETALALDIEAVSILLYDEISNSLRISVSFVLDGFNQDEVPPVPSSTFVEAMVNTDNQIIIPDSHELTDQP